MNILGEVGLGIIQYVINLHDILRMHAGTRDETAFSFSLRVGNWDLNFFAKEGESSCLKFIYKGLKV